MAVHDEAVFGSRPWHVYGEGPTELVAGMQNESGFKGFDEHDVRFTVNRGSLYIFFLKPPTRPIAIAALGRERWQGRIVRATQLGQGPVAHLQDDKALALTLAPQPGFVPVVKIEGAGIA